MWIPKCFFTFFLHPWWKLQTSYFKQDNLHLHHYICPACLCYHRIMPRPEKNTWWTHHWFRQVQKHETYPLWNGTKMCAFGLPNNVNTHMNPLPIHLSSSPCGQGLRLADETWETTDTLDDSAVCSNNFTVVISTRDLTETHDQMWHQQENKYGEWLTLPASRSGHINRWTRCFFFS